MFTSILGVCHLVLTCPSTGSWQHRGHRELVAFPMRSGAGVTTSVCQNQSQQTAHPWNDLSGLCGKLPRARSHMRRFIRQRTVLREQKTERGNKTGMQPTVTCLVVVGAVLAAGTRERGKAMCWRRMEAQEDSPPGHLTAVSWHVLVCEVGVRAAFRLPSAPLSGASLT